MEPVNAPEGPTERRLRDLRPTDVPVAITARIVTIQRREVQRKSDGDRRPVVSGLLSDGTATVRFTWWDPPHEEIDRGTVIRAAPVQVREFQGRPELTFGWRTRVAPASEADLPEIRSEEVPARTLGSLEARDEGFRVDVRVLEVESKSVSVGAERRQVYQGLLADGTGVVAFSAWSDFRLKPEESVRISGAYVRNFRGRPQLVLDERSLIERISPGTLPTRAEALPDAPQPLGVVSDHGGSERAVVEGRALALQPPSGLLQKCPQCPRLVREGLCKAHGAVKGEPDLRLRLVLDDGTGAVTLNLDRPATERLTGLTMSDCARWLSEHPDPSEVEARLLATVFGLRLRAQGAVRKDDFGLSMYPSEVTPLVAPASDRDRLLSRLSVRGR